MNVNFFKLFFCTIFRGLFNHKKRNWSNLIIGFLVHFQKIILDNLEYCNRFWRRSSFDFFFFFAYSAKNHVI